jgi:hypothetical protein
VGVTFGEGRRCVGLTLGEEMQWGQCRHWGRGGGAGAPGVARRWHRIWTIDVGGCWGTDGARGDANGKGREMVMGRRDTERSETRGDKDSVATVSHMKRHAQAQRRHLWWDRGTIK